MSHFLFIESRDAFESRDALQTLQLAEELARDGKRVSLFLVQNAVLLARAKARAPEFQRLVTNGKIKVYADDYSLEERGVQTEEMHREIEIAGASKLVDLVMDAQTKPIWH